MPVSVSLLFVAAGAILAFAVTGSPSGVDLHAVGWILIGAGLLGLALSLILWESWVSRARRAPRRPPRL